MRTSVYVDGFNLYYRALRGTPYKWLDLKQLVSNLLAPNHIISDIKTLPPLDTLPEPMGQLSVRGEITEKKGLNQYG